VTHGPRPNPLTNDEAQGADFAALADAPVAALDMSSSVAEALEEALGVKTVRELAENKYVRRAQAILHMASDKR
jgi:hypothetical protein